MLQFFGLFYQIRKYLILKQINIVYKTIIQPVLQYWKLAYANTDINYSSWNKN